MKHLVFYISGHGFGHASRSIEVINALLARAADLRVSVRTTAPKWLFDRTVRGAFAYEHFECDTGLVQIDSLHLDIARSLDAARAFMRDVPARAAREAARLRADGVSLVLSDIPALGVLAGAEAGVPSIAIGNFTWDWIYAAYDGAGDIVPAVADAYARADLALRMPMGGGFDTFSRVKPIPFVARHATHDPATTKRALGLPLDRPLVLMSFGGYGVEGMNLKALGRITDYAVIVSNRVGPLPAGLTPLDEDAMYAKGFRYEDLVRAVDVVATKPGYGIIAECIANDTALLYTSRGRFVEYDVMVAEMPRCLRVAYIPHDELFAGNWTPYLDALTTSPPPPERPATNGAEVVADLVTGFLH